MKDKENKIKNNNKNKNKKGKKIYIFGTILIIIGIILLNMQNIIQFSYEKEVEDEKDDFIEFKDTEENNYLLYLLYERLLEENINLYENNQSELKDPFSYEQTAIDLTEYGITNNTIGYISIPKMGIELPILLRSIIKQYEQAVQYT